MRGLVKPCRHRLGRTEYLHWRAHLCGLCLALRDHAGTAARVLTGYDVLLPSVLVEAQQGTLPTRTAGPCALRGGAMAEVIRSDTAGAQFAVTTATLASSAGLVDKLEDGDVPEVARPLARRAAVTLRKKGELLADYTGFDAQLVLGGNAAASEVEGSGSSLEDLLAPSGSVVAAVFAHTAVVAGVPENEEALRKMGDAYGRLVHLIDAHDDRSSDLRAGKFNPLETAGVSADAARAQALRLASEIRSTLESIMFVQPALVGKLLGPELRRTVDKAFGVSTHAEGSHGCGNAVVMPAAIATAAIALSGSQYNVLGNGFGRKRRSGDYGNSRSRFMCIPCCIPCDCCCPVDCCGECGD